MRRRRDVSGAFDRGLLLFSREQTSRRTVVTTRRVLYHEFDFEGTHDTPAVTVTRPPCAVVAVHHRTVLNGRDGAVDKG